MNEQSETDVKNQVLVDNTNMSKEFGIILEDLIKSRNLSIRQFSQDIGFKPSTVNEWIGKNGRFPSSPEVLKKLSIYFNISIHELLYGEPEQSVTIQSLLKKDEAFSGIYEISLKKVSFSGTDIKVEKNKQN